MGKLVQRYNPVVFINDYQQEKDKLLDMFADWPATPFDKTPADWQFLQQSLQSILFTYDKVMSNA